MRRGFLALSLLLATLPACSDSSTEFWQSSNDVLPTVMLEDHVAVVEKNSATAFVLDPGDPSLTPKLAAVGKNPVTAVKHNGGNQLLVLSAGDHGSADKQPVPAKLVVVSPAAIDSPTAYELGSQFDGVAQSDEGRFAVLYHTSSTQDVNSGALFNPNDLEVADFGDTHAAEPTLTPKPIRSLGGVPSTSNPSASPIQFSPDYIFPAGTSRLAVVLSQDYVTVFDLYHLDHDEISVPLCPAGGTCNYSVDQVVFDPANSQPSSAINIYVRTNSAKDIFQITFTDTGPAGPTASGNSFIASLSMFAVGASSADMVLFGTGEDARLGVVTPDARNLVILDPKTGSGVPLPLPIPANTIVPFVTTDPSTARQETRAMLLDLQRGSTSVLSVDLDAAKAANGLTPDQYAIPGAATLVVPLQSQGIAFLMYGRSSSNAVFSVVNLADKLSLFDFNSSSALGAAFLENRKLSTGDRGTRLWSVDSPDGGRPSPNSGIHFLDLVPRGQPSTSIWLDETIASITPLFNPSSDGIRYLVLEQTPNAYGNLTFVNADNPDRATARTARGFLFASYLGRTAP